MIVFLLQLLFLICSVYFPLSSHCLFKWKLNYIVSPLKTLFPKAFWKEFKLLTKIYKIQPRSSPRMPLQFHFLLFNHPCFLSFLENSELFPSKELMHLFPLHKNHLPLALCLATSISPFKTHFSLLREAPHEHSTKSSSPQPLSSVTLFHVKIFITIWNFIYCLFALTKI